MNKTKIILFDIDGVLINIPHYFSVELENNGYNNVTESLNGYFLGKDCKQCTEGKADAVELIKPYIEKFGWEKSSDEYLKQQFEFECKYIDTVLLSFIQKLRKNTKCYLASDQEKNRANYILDKCSFKSSFDGDFMSCDIGHRKSDVNFWHKTLEGLEGVKPSEIVFFDDTQKNIDVAKTLGIKTFLYTDINTFYDTITSL